MSLQRLQDSLFDDDLHHSGVHRKHRKRRHFHHGHHSTRAVAENPRDLDPDDGVYTRWGR
ncbi:hypothetical protein AAVH_20965 [Aphelenchoides avenae]|nr:hypothetical protein AAVH_20965 [Aphelenchus avenae]